MFRTLAFALAGSLLLGAAAHGQPDRRVRVAILPMVVHAQDDQEYLRGGVADMLTARVGQSPDIAVIRVKDISKATTSVESARAAGEEVGAQFVLYGSFTTFGQGASLDARCVAVRGDAPERSVFIQAGSLGEIIPRIDELAAKVINYVLQGEPSAPNVASGPPPNAASNGITPDALTLEVESLRQRVEKLEAMLGATPAGDGQGAP